MTILADRFSRAVDYACIAHAAQVRKGSNIPCLYYLLGVASLVIEFGGNEDQTIAGRPHDVVEDCAEAHRHLVRTQFGNAVADIVEACTDGTAEGKARHTDAEAKRRSWVERKLAYRAHLQAADHATALRYYEALARALTAKQVEAVPVLDAVVGQMHVLAGAKSREVLG